ncbi:MAG: hypothetical protein HC912_10305 [Saprospiraceae bacterium]|nr:hypothetical protein [Saprospiraceae bacterium]
MKSFSLLKQPLLTFFDNHVLIEQSTLFPAQNLQQAIFLLRTRGYRPILAHPERYVYYQNHFEKFEEIKSYGCLFQLNLLSLSGYYGHPQQKLAIQLLKSNMIDLLGTDIHHQRHATALANMVLNTTINKFIQQAITFQRSFL